MTTPRSIAASSRCGLCATTCAVAARRREYRRKAGASAHWISAARKARPPPAFWPAPHRRRQGRNRRRRISEKASSSAGIRSVSTSRARGHCARRGAGRNASRAPSRRPAAGSRKPISRRVSSVSGSSVAPVNTRLPARESSPGACSNRRRVMLFDDAQKCSQIARKTAQAAIAAKAREILQRSASSAGRRWVCWSSEHLQAMFQRAQEDIGLRQLVHRFRRDPPLDLQAERSMSSVRAPRRRGRRPPKISCWVWTKNSISRMPPRPSLTSWPATAISAWP